MKTSLLHRLAAAAIITLTSAAISLPLLAQEKPAEPPTPAPAVEHRSSRQFDPAITDCRNQPNRTQMTDCREAHIQTRTIFLTSAGQQNDVNEILIAVRNMFDPSLKVFLLSSKNAISLSSYPEELDRIQAYIKTLDIPRKTYRLNYTLTDFDGDKRVGNQHFSMVIVSGQRMTLKQGSKIPVATGKADDTNQTQFTYIDVGMNFDATISGGTSTVQLESKVEQSSVAPEPVTIAGVAEPIIRQSVLQGTSVLSPGKPITLGSVDVTGSTHHLEITVMMEPLPTP